MSIYLKKKLIVNLEYQGRKIIVEIPPYKQIKYIKEIAKNSFYILNSKITLLYQHRDITEHEESLIGDYFKKKNQVSIKVTTNYKHNLNNLKNDMMTFLNYQKITLKCQICKFNYIENYCRTCKQFICNQCRLNNLHESHKSIQVNIENLIDSVRLYAITLQSEILSNHKVAREYVSKHKEKKMENKRNINERYNIILDKYNKISDIFNQLINNIDINEKNVNEDDTIILNDYINKTNGVNNEIEMLLNEINEKYILQNKKMKKEEFEKYFNELNDKENSLDIKSINILEYRVNAEINNKMNQIYDELEEILDQTLNSKNPLGIDSHVNYMYNFVKGKRKKISDNKEKSDKEKIDKEKIDKEKIDKEKIDKKKIDEEKIDEEKINTEKIEEEKINAEKIDKEKINTDTNEQINNGNENNNGDIDNNIKENDNVDLTSENNDDNKNEDLENNENKKEDTVNLGNEEEYLENEEKDQDLIQQNEDNFD